MWPTKERKYTRASGDHVTEIFAVDKTNEHDHELMAQQRAGRSIAARPQGRAGGVSQLVVKRCRL